MPERHFHHKLSAFIAPTPPELAFLRSLLGAKHRAASLLTRHDCPIIFADDAACAARLAAGILARWEELELARKAMLSAAAAHADGGRL